MTTLQSADKSALDKLVSSLRTPVFLAGLDEKPRPCLTLHTARSGAGRNLRREAKQALARSGIGVRCKVREHSASRLEKDSSLDRLVRRFRHDSIVFDPTGGVGRAQAVTRCAKSIREALGDGIAGIYLEPWRRVLYVVLRRDAVMQDGKVAAARVRAIESSLAAAVGQAVGQAVSAGAKPLELAIRVGFRPPSIPVVPVDHASALAVRARPQLLNKLRTGSIAATVAAFFGIGVAGTAMAEGPAVSGPNAKISAGGGVVDGDRTGLALGSATAPLGDNLGVPLGDNLGVQIDGLYGKIGGDLRWGAGGHLFWGDPDKGMLGVTGSYSRREDHDPDWMSRVGVEGEAFRDRVTVSVQGGYQFGDVDEGEFGRIDLRWYATDDFMLSAGGEVETGDFVGRLKAEYQPGLSALPGLSLFADGEIGEDNWSRAFVGIRYYFGAKTKSLIRRHREDDPPNRLADLDFAMRDQGKKAYG